MNLVFTKLSKNNVALSFFLWTLVFNLLLFLLAVFGYYFNFVKYTNNFLPVLLTLTAFYILAWTKDIKKFWVITITMIFALILAWFSLTNNSYESIESPKGSKKVLIVHRDVSLGETNHYYDFYLFTSIPGLMKKVNEDTLQISTRGESVDNLKVLGLENVEWGKDEIIFDSPYAGKTQIDIND